MKGKMAMVRKITSTAMMVSFLALASSGLLMMFGGGSFLRFMVHPVHEMFGIIMLAAGVVHTWLNWKPMVNYLRKRPVMIVFVILVGLLAVMLAVGASHQPDPLVLQKLGEIKAHMGH